MGSFNSCPVQQECIGDYVAITASSVTSLIILLGVFFLWWKRHTPEVKAKQVSLLVAQGLGSILWLISLLMGGYVRRFHHYGLFLSCYLWQVWVNAPLGYSLVVSCYVARAYRLYQVFVRRRLPKFQSWHLVLVLLVPSFCMAAVLQWRRPFKTIDAPHYPYKYCTGGLGWWLLNCAVYGFYICMLVVPTWLLRNIRFEFNESKELLASVCASTLFLGVFLSVVFVTFFHKNRDASYSFEAAAAYTLIFLGCATALCFSLFPVLRPLKSYLTSRLKKKKGDSMGQALGVPDTGLIHPFASFRFDEPFEALLQHKRFKQAFQAFADSRVAGELVRFHTDICDRSRISTLNSVARIYMAQHIIETYVEIGSPQEINISCAMRSEILGTTDLSSAALFDPAAREVIEMIHTNLEHDFWQSPEFQELKDEIDAEAEFAEQLEWMDISSKRDSFSNHDNMFENGSPHRQLRHASLSPIHRALLASPENFRLQVDNSPQH